MVRRGSGVRVPASASRNRCILTVFPLRRGVWTRLETREGVRGSSSLVGVHESPANPAHPRPAPGAPGDEKGVGVEIGVKMARVGRDRRCAEHLVAPLPVFLTATRLSAAGRSSASAYMGNRVLATGVPLVHGRSAQALRSGAWAPSRSWRWLLCLPLTASASSRRSTMSRLWSRERLAGSTDGACPVTRSRMAAADQSGGGAALSRVRACWRV